MNKPLIVYIHGAFCDSSIFNFIKDKVPVKGITVDYDWGSDYKTAVETIISHLPKDEKLFLVGSSLGGLYSLLAADQLKDRVIGGISISTPYGGSIGTSLIRICKFMFLNDYSSIPDLNPLSELIQTVRKVKLPSNWSGIVTTAGHNPLGIIPNDGIVSLESMRARKELPTINLPYGHIEVMTQIETVKVILQAYSNSINTQND